MSPNDVMKDEVNEFLVDESMSHLPKEWLMSENDNREKLEDVVENLAKNILYIDGSKRGVRLAWEDHQTQFKAVVNVVFRRNSSKLELHGHNEEGFFNEAWAISLKTGFSDYDGRAQLSKLVLFDAQQALRKLTGRPPSALLRSSDIRNTAAFCKKLSTGRLKLDIDV